MIDEQKTLCLNKGSANDAFFSDATNVDFTGEPLAVNRCSSDKPAATKRYLARTLLGEGATAVAIL